jgi:hypothetical protein
MNEKKARVTLAIAGLSILQGCSSSAPPPGDAGAGDAGHNPDARADAHDAGNDASDAAHCSTKGESAVMVTVVSHEHLVQATPSVDVEVRVPSGCWSSVKVTMTVTSDCTGVPPAGQNWPTECDPYDRLAQVWLADEGTTPLFVMDAVTSFGGTATWTQDLTDYYALLVGKHDYHVEIDTYSDSSGQVTGTASSHDATVTIELTPGVPPHEVLAAIPLFRQTLTGDGGADASPALTAKLIAPDGATAGRLDYFTSGHGANGPLMECDEFCDVTNDVEVDGKNLYAKAPKADCSTNCTHVPASGSFSCGGETFDYYCKQNPESCPSSAVAPRSNWCPSRIIAPIAIPLPASALAGEHEVGVRLLGANGNWPVGLAAVFYGAGP